MIEQSCNKDIRIYFDLQNKMKTIGFIFVLILWLLNALVLSKSFTGVLLESFFKVKTVPIVSSLQDIRDNKRLMIGGHHLYLSMFSKSYKYNLSDIIKRVDQDKDNALNGVYSARIAESY